MNNTCQCTTNHIILNWISKHKMDEWACTQITFLLLFAHMTIIYDFFFYVFFSKEYSRGSAILARHIDTSCKGKFPICLDQQTTIIVRCLQYVRVAYSLRIIKFYNILCRARQQSFLRPATLWSTHNRRKLTTISFCSIIKNGFFMEIFSFDHVLAPPYCRP